MAQLTDPSTASWLHLLCPGFMTLQFGAHSLSLLYHCVVYLFMTPMQITTSTCTLLFVLLLTTMSDDEDDYLSDKFLVGTSSAPAVAAPKTYSQLRKDAEKQAMLKNEQNRHKSRFQLERETREEGLKKSLFERAEEEPVAGNKALNMMMKMGFKPGQVLGKVDDDESVEVTSQSHNKAEPLPINEWEGAILAIVWPGN